MKFKFMAVGSLVILVLVASLVRPVSAAPSKFHGDNLYDFYSRALPSALSAYAHDHNGFFPAARELTGDPETDVLLKAGFLSEYYENPLAPGTRVMQQSLDQQTPGNFTYIEDPLPPSYAIVVLQGDAPSPPAFAETLGADVTMPWVLRTEPSPSYARDTFGRMVRVLALGSATLEDSHVLNTEALTYALLNELPNRQPWETAMNWFVELTAKVRYERGTLRASIHARQAPQRILFGFTVPDFTGFHRRFAVWQIQVTATKSLHEIQIAFERYAVDNRGAYPSGSAALLEMGFLVKFPVNAFSPDHDMRPVAPDAPTTGDFVYVPLYPLGAGAESRPTGYFLGLVGPTGAKGTKINPRIIVWYTAGIDTKDGPTTPTIKTWEDVMREWFRVRAMAIRNPSKMPASVP